MVKIQLLLAPDCRAPLTWEQLTKALQDIVSKPVNGPVTHEILVETSIRGGVKTTRIRIKDKELKWIFGLYDVKGQEIDSLPNKLTYLQRITVNSQKGKVDAELAEAKLRSMFGELTRRYSPKAKVTP